MFNQNSLMFHNGAELFWYRIPLSMFSRIKRCLKCSRNCKCTKIESNVALSGLIEFAFYFFIPHIKNSTTYAILLCIAFDIWNLGNLSHFTMHLFLRKTTINFRHLSTSCGQLKRQNSIEFCWNLQSKIKEPYAIAQGKRH